MNLTNKSEKRLLTRLNHTQVARTIFVAAESMGISNRNRLDKLTSQVIRRLERPQVLPGMEHLVAKKTCKQLERPVTDFEILAIVKEFLATEELEQRGKTLSKEEGLTMLPETKAQTAISLTENALRVLKRRYLRKDKHGGVIEMPEEMFRRVARTISAAELIYDPKADVGAMEDQFYWLMADLEFLPNSPTLMNAGRELGQLSACFVLPIEDSMESIFGAVKNTALIHKSGGGTGFSFSRLRSEGDRVGSTGGVASGPVSFMRAFDVATEVIKQGGTRRGANMGILNVSHPDIVKFIMAKQDLTSLTNFNISVAITSAFMEAVKTGSDYNLINPHTKEMVGTLNAKVVFDKIVDMAWKTGDPGIVFLDRMNKDNPTPHLGNIESTNPCGEQPLLPYESCNLGSINLVRMLRTKNETVEVDYPKLARTVKLAVRFLDNVIDVNKFPLPEIEEMTKKSRKIGLGIMGFADMLIGLGIPYSSNEALELAEDVTKYIQDEATEASRQLAQERGVFPAFEGSVYDHLDGIRVRNATRTTIAPTGTLSLIAGCSSGIEPLFALSYKRNVLDGTGLVEINSCFEQTAKREGFYSEELMQKLADGICLSDIDNVPQETKQLFTTAHEIGAQWHVKMQAAFQKFTNNAVSKTVNFPREATRQDIAQVYLQAYEDGLKGITIYRDGSREGQVLTTGKIEEKTEEIRLAPRKRAKITTGITERITTGCGYIYVTVNSDEWGICEVFSHLGKAGGCASAQLEATCRLVSLALRSEIGVDSIVRQLRGIRCPSIAWEDGKSILSCADAMASVLEKHTDNKGNNGGGTKPIQDYGLAKNIAGQCPDCGSLLVYQEGCFICPGCGYTKC